MNEKEENIKKLVEDLLSRIKTGLTVSEVALLQELLAKISSLKNENSKNQEGEEEINEILNELFTSNHYTMLLKTGESEFSTKEEFSMMIDSIGKLRKNSDTKVKEENLIVELKQTLVKIEESITKKKNTTTDEELKLLEKIKNN